MSKISIIAFIATFYLVLPFPFMWMGIGGFYQLDTKDLQGVEKEEFTIINLAIKTVNYILVFFQLFTIGIPDAPSYIFLFVVVFRVLSVLAMLLVLRG